jgi:hypothetical protein
MDRADPGRSGEHGQGVTTALDHLTWTAPPPDDLPTGQTPAAAARPAARHLGLLIGYLIAGIVVTWPRASYLAGRLPATADTASYVWSFWWVAHQVTHLGNPWFTPYLAAPVGIQLGFDTLMPLAGLVMTPVTLAFGPSAAVTLLVIALPGLLCYVMYRVARLWLTSQPGAIAAGAFFGLSTMVTQQDWYHLNIAVGELFLPMALEAAVRLRRQPSSRRAVILGMVLGGVVLANQESAVLAVILAGLALLPWLGRRPRADRRRPAALAGLTAALVASPQIVAMAQQALGGGTSSRPGVLAHWYAAYGAGVTTLFAPSPRLASAGLAGVAALYHYGYPGEAVPTFGAALSGLAVFGAVLAWRRTSTRRLAALWAGAAALALGATLRIGTRNYVPLAQAWHGARLSPVMPYTWLVQIPGLAAFREADRFALLGIVPAALLAGRAIDWLLGHAKPVAALAIALGILEAGFSAAGPVMPTTLTPLDRPMAADHTGDIVVDVPYGLRGGLPVYGTRLSVQSLLMATADGHPRAASYTSWVPAPSIAATASHVFYAGLVAAQDGQPRSAAELAGARDDARRMSVGWVVVWQADPLVIHYLTSTGFHRAYQADGAVVYRGPSRALNGATGSGRGHHLGQR